MTSSREDPWAEDAPSFAAKLAQFFHARPNTWIDGKVLALVGGGYAWRTRISDLRRAPFHLVIENRQRRIEAHGHPIIISEYRFVQEVRTEEEAADDAATSPAAV
jgi:hypothetical protein